MVVLCCCCCCCCCCRVLPFSTATEFHSLQPTCCMPSRPHSGRNIPLSPTKQHPPPPNEPLHQHKQVTPKIGLWTPFVPQGSQPNFVEQCPLVVLGLLGSNQVTRCMQSAARPDYRRCSFRNLLSYGMDHVFFLKCFCTCSLDL